MTKEKEKLKRKNTQTRNFKRQKLYSKIRFRLRKFNK